MGRREQDGPINRGDLKSLGKMRGESQSEYCRCISRSPATDVNGTDGVRSEIDVEGGVPEVEATIESERNRSSEDRGNDEYWKNRSAAVQSDIV
jgi:hypothetical protein